MDITKETSIRQWISTIVFGAIFVFFVQNVNALSVTLDGRNKFAGIPSGIIYDVEVVGDAIYVASENGVFEVIGGRSSKLAFNTERNLTGTISDIEYDSSGHLWIVEYGVGVFQIRLSDRTAKEFILPDEWKKYVWTLSITDTHAAFSLVSGVYVVNKSTGKVAEWAKDIGVGSVSKAYSVISANQSFYVASENELITISLKQKLVSKDTRQDNYSELSTLNIVTLHDETMYVGGKEGIYAITEKTKTFIPFSNAPNRLDIISDIYTSSNGEVWVAAGGLYRVSNGVIAPANFMNPTIYSESIRSITAIAETNVNELLVASSQLGLIAISEIHRAINFLHVNGNVLEKSIVAHGIDSNGDFRLSTRDKTYSVDVNSGRLTPISDNQTAACMDKNATIFIELTRARESSSVSCSELYFHTFSVSDESFYVYRDNGTSAKYYLVNDGRIVDTITAPRQVLYSTLSNAGEIIAYDAKSNIHLQLSKLSWRTVNVHDGGWSGITCLIELAEAYLICTSGMGLIELRKDTGKIGKSDILKPREIRFIRGAVLSNNDKLWVSTNMGLFVYDVVDGDSYYVGDESGILDSDFEYNSFILYGGHLIVLGDRYPYLINESVILQAILSGENKGAKPVYTHLGWGIGTQRTEIHFPVGGEERHEVGHDYGTMAINIGTNSFLAHENQKIEFRILGLSPDWVTHPESFIYLKLSDLDYGDYQVESRILEGNNRGTLSRMQFSISPPLYFSSAAIAIYIFIFLMIIILARMGYFVPFKNYLKTTKLYQFISRYELTDGQSKFEKTLRAKDRHISNIAHDLRTPLQIILGSLEKDSEKASMSGVELSSLRQNAMRIEQLVEQMSSTVPNIEGSKSLFSQYTVEDINRVVMNLEPLAKAKRQHLDITVRGKQHISLISDSLEKIVSNLVENAIKYTPKHGHIKVCATIDDKNLKIVVSDDGEGIDACNHKKVLERFVRVHKGEIEGQGIGLALVDDLVKLNQGKLILGSALGKGTRWTVTFPIDDTELVNAEQSEESESKKWDDRQTVLVVDDSREFRTYMFNLLSKSYRCLIAKSGRQALDIMSSYHIDLVITDLMMMGLDGLSLTEKIRSHESWAATPIIILTAKTDESTKRKALEEKADYYLTKPTQNDELLLLVKHLLSLRSLTASNGACQPMLPQLGESIKIPEFNSEKDMNFYLNFIEVLEKNYHNEHFNRDMAADHLLMSPRSLNRKLSELFEYNFSEFLTRFRIDKAVPLLVSGASVITTGMEVGFGTPSYFSTSFKKIKGVSPKKFVDERKVGEQ